MIKLRHTTYDIRYTKHGFTLIELIVTIVILGILVGFAVPLVLKFVESFQYSIYRKDLSEQADLALRRMSREMRRLKDDRSVITANAAAYRFTDIDGKIVQFQLNGNDLKREYDGQTDTLASNVSSFSFIYLDDQGSPISSPVVSPQTEIKFIDINMTLESDNNTINYRTQIRPRNVTHISDLFS